MCFVFSLKSVGNSELLFAIAVVRNSGLSAIIHTVITQIDDSTDITVSYDT